MSLHVIVCVGERLVVCLAMLRAEDVVVSAILTLVSAARLGVFVVIVGWCGLRLAALVFVNSFVVTKLCLSLFRSIIWMSVLVLCAFCLVVLLVGVVMKDPIVLL